MIRDNKWDEHLPEAARSFDIESDSWGLTLPEF
jgi:hypothetical protein